VADFQAADLMKLHCGFPGASKVGDEEKGRKMRKSVDKPQCVTYL